MNRRRVRNVVPGVAGAAVCAVSDGSPGFECETSMSTGESRSNQCRSIVGTYPLEQAGYFGVPGAELYTVLHGAADPVARVLLVGPLASERHYSYIPWVRWARYLSERRVESLRYDYRGIGESTGAFEQMSFEHWIEDAELLARWLSERDPAVPVVLHGLGLGALLAAKAFEKGLGSGLLMWAPPADAHRALRSLLVRSINLEQSFKFGDERKLPSEYLGQLESGVSIEVDGYRWSGNLWRDSFGHPMPFRIEEGAEALAAAEKRPIRAVKLDHRDAPLVNGSAVGYEAVTKDFTRLFAENFEWLTTSITNA